MSSQSPEPTVGESSNAKSPRERRRRRTAPYRVGLILGACLTLLGIADAIAFETVVSPVALLTGWLVIAWSTHRMGRSGPMLGWATSHSAEPRPPRLDQD